MTASNQAVILDPGVEHGCDLQQGDTISLRRASCWGSSRVDREGGAEKRVF